MPTPTAMPLPAEPHQEPEMPPENEMLQLLNEVFDFEGNKLRVVGSQKEPLFVAQDVCGILKIQDSGQASENLDADEKGTCKIRTPGGTQEMIVLTRAGLLRLVLKSRKAEAKKFQRWVLHDLLDEIARTGSYKGKGATQRGVNSTDTLPPTNAVPLPPKPPQDSDRIDVLEAKEALLQVMIQQQAAITLMAQLLNR